MKKFMMMMVAVIAMTACTNNENEKEDVTTDGKVLTSINFGGDVSFKEEALTRAVNGGRTYVAIQIDSFRYNPYYGDTLYQRIVEGIFEYTQGINVNLQKGNNYKVRAAIVLDGGDKYYIDSEGKVQRPLARRGGFAPVSNKFTATWEVQVDDAEYFTVCDPAGSAIDFKNPMLNYYIGETIVKGGDKIDLKMTRKNAAIRFCITPPSSGKLEVYSYMNPRFIYELTPESEKVDEVKMYALPYNATTMDVSFTIIYTNAAGKVYDYSVQKTLKNKTITTLNVAIKQGNNPDTPNEGAESGISMTYDSGMTFDETINIE